MDSKKLHIAENALRQIAEREGTTVDAVREEIRAAIAMGRNDPSPAARAFWQSFPCEGSEPTPEESSSVWRRMRAAGQMAGISESGTKSRAVYHRAVFH